jgi:hypothetical protein
MVKRIADEGVLEKCQQFDDVPGRLISVCSFLLYAVRNQVVLPRVTAMTGERAILPHSSDRAC